MIAQLEGVDAATLSSLADQYLNQLQPGVVALASAADGKVFFAVKVSKELTGKLNAGAIVREMASSPAAAAAAAPTSPRPAAKTPARSPPRWQKRGR